MYCNHQCYLISSSSFMALNRYTGWLKWNEDTELEMDPYCIFSKWPSLAATQTVKASSFISFSWQIAHHNGLSVTYHKLKLIPKMTDEFKVTLQSVWEKLPKEIISKMVENFTKCFLTACVVANGCKTGPFPNLYPHLSTNNHVGKGNKSWTLLRYSITCYRLSYFRQTCGGNSQLYAL